MVTLPAAPDVTVLLVRTDYSEDAAWREAYAAATAVYPRDDFDRLGALLRAVESPELDGLTPTLLAQLPRDAYLGEIAVADAQTMRDRTILFVDLDAEVGRTFRAIPTEVEAIVANLSISNMDFREFADNVDPDGVFRGFR